MTNNERELINIIRNHDNPEQAIEIAITTILAFLEQQKSFEEQAPAYSRELA
jgi:hypothetical protein